MSESISGKRPIRFGMSDGISSKRLDRLDIDIDIEESSKGMEGDGRKSGKEAMISSGKQPVSRAISFNRLSAEDLAKLEEADHHNDADDKDEMTDAASLDYEEIRNRLELFRQNVKTFMFTSPVGKCYHSLYVGLCVCSLFVYAASTYYGPFSFQRVEKAFSVIIFFDWLLFFCLADRKLEYISSFSSTINLVSAIPIWITLDTTYPDVHNHLSSTEAFLAVIHGLAITRILRAVRINYFFQSVQDPVVKFVAEFASTFVVVIIFHAALMKFIEDKQNFPLHSWIYYVCATSSTVGYGDITPRTTAGRLACIYIICFSVIFVPKMTNDLLQVMSMQSIYLRAKYVPSWNSQHVVVCGNFSSTALTEFFSELFHTDHVFSKDSVDVLHAVIVHPGPPSTDILKIMADPAFRGHITYIEGSVLLEKDLIRAHAQSAVGVFILADKFAANPDEEDANTALQACSIRRYVDNERNEGATIGDGESEQTFVMQLIRSENEMMVPNNKNTDKSIVLCFNDIKMGIIAKSTVFPGAATLIMNLVSSFSRNVPQSAERTHDTEFRKNLNSAAVRMGQRKSIYSVVNEAKPKEGAVHIEDRRNWLLEYQEGCDWELYTAVLAPVFDGAKFIDLSFILQQRSGILMIGLHVLDYSCGLSKVLLNPAFMVIPSSQNYEVSAIIIAKNVRDTQQLSTPSQTETLFFANALRHSKMTAQKEAAKTSKRSESSRSSSSKSVFVRRRCNQLSLPKITNNVSSVQENLRSSASRALRSLTHLLPAPRKLTDCVINGSVSETFPRMSHHIVIVGKDMTHLFDLIRPLRARYLGHVKPIVVLHPDTMPESVWGQISSFPDIIVVKGSNLDDEQLIRAGIFRAEQAIVLADSKAHQRAIETGSSSNLAQAEALVDADAVLTYKAIRTLNPRVHVMIEVFSARNISYLENLALGILPDVDYRLSKPFASGSVFTAACLDTLCCQVFFNPLIVKIVRKLCTGVDTIDKVDLLTQTLAQELQKSGGESDIVTARKNSILNKVVESSLYAISLPEGTANKSYGNLFQVLAKQNTIPLGLLRTRDIVGMSASLTIADTYVYTNPSRAAIVYSSDKVFVLSSTPVKHTVKDSAAWSATSEDLMRHFSMSAKHRRGSVQDHSHFHVDHDKATIAKLEELQSSMRLEVEKMIQNHQRELDSQIQAMKETQAKLEDMLSRMNASIVEVDAPEGDRSPTRRRSPQNKSHRGRSQKGSSANPGELLPQVARSQKLKAGGVDISSYLDFDLDLPAKIKPSFSAVNDGQTIIPTVPSEA